MTSTPSLSNIGFRLIRNPPRAPREVVEAFQGVPTTDIADAVTKMFTMSTAIQPLYRPIRRAAGSAVTVRVPPGDNLMVHVALDYLQDGDVLVVDARGSTDFCLGGGLMTSYAKHKGVKGFILDGAYRDASELQKLDFPVYGRGVNPTSPTKVGPGEINTVIQCGGVPVHPGDIVVADPDGTVVVPLEYAHLVLDKVRQRADTDTKKWADLDQAERAHRERYAALLATTPCLVK